MTPIRPVGSALPPRRISAASPSVKVLGGGLSQPIIVERARDRLWESFERQLMPQDVRNILAGTINGDSWEWARLYTAMLDSWPALQKCLSELQRDVRNAKWQVKPYCEMGEDPTPADEDVAKECSRMLWGCKPRPAYAEGGLEDLMEWTVSAYFTGIGVNEIDWFQVAGEWRPRAYKPVSARYYGYDNMTDGEDRLMLRPNPDAYSAYEDFPEHRFLIGIHGGHPGHPTVSAPLRVLTGYWLAAVFGLEWFMKFAQLFGVPLRWATYTDENSKPAMIQMMEQIGNGGWGVGPSDAKVEFEESSKSATALPQYEMLKLADEQCEKFMLGQTLTSGVSSAGGSRALGDVHADTKQCVVRGICDFTGRIISSQLIPAWSYWNTGAVSDNLPEFFPEWPEPKDEKAMAERDEKIGIFSGDTPVSKAYVYERYNIKPPEEGEELFKAKVAPPGNLPPVDDKLPPPDGEPKDGPIPPKVAAADQPGTLLELLQSLPVTPVEDIAKKIEEAAKEGL